MTDGDTMLAAAFSPAAQRPAAPLAGPVSGAKPRREAADPLAAQFETAPVRTLAAKEHLYCEGDPATHVYRVEVGHMVIYRTMPDGRRQVIDFAFPGDLVGLGALGTHATHALATGASVLRCLPTALLTTLAGLDPRLGMRLYEAVSRELIASRELLFTVSQRTATERLASFLLALSRRNARRGGSPDEIVLPMTRSDIADFLGLTIETVSRTFTRLRTEGVIDLEQCILVTIRDPEALAALAVSDAGRRH
jgi:CRP/FNR family transcriptional regulator